MIGDLAICIVAAWLLAVGAQLLRQPLLLAYLAAGFIVGPVGLGLVHDHHSIEVISELGLILLLFMIGLEIDLKKILGAGRLITLTSLAQIVGCFAGGLVLFKLLGFPLAPGRWDALYLAVGAALSSTVIIVKLLYEKRELDTLPGRLTLGVLVIQDLAAILFLAIQPNLNEASPGLLLGSLARVGLLVALAYVAARHALPALFRSVARLPELVLVGALAWCFLVAGTASALGLSKEMGALIAGVAISTFPYTLDVAAKVTSLRDFFITLFFVALGMSIPAPNGPSLGWALLIAAFVVASRLATVFPPLHRMGQGIRASLLPALNLAQISELSLVVLTLGVAHKHIGAETQAAFSYAFVILGVVSTYAITKSNEIHAALLPRLRRMGFKDIDATPPEAHPAGHPKIFLLGFYTTASSLLEELERHAPHLLAELAVVDFNPAAHQKLKERGVRVIYGDITRRETLEHAGVGGAELLVCTLPNSLLKGATNLKLLAQLRELNPTAQIITHAEQFEDAPKLYAAGASHVSLPRLIEARDLCSVIQAARQSLLPERRADLELELRGRREIIP